jgi:hypothetical protein
MAESGRTLASVNVAAEKNIPVTFAVASAPANGSPAPLGTQQPSTESPEIPVSAPQPQADTGGADQEKHLRSILKGG